MRSSRAVAAWFRDGAAGDGGCSVTSAVVTIASLGDGSWVASWSISRAEAMLAVALATMSGIAGSTAEGVVAASWTGMASSAAAGACGGATAVFAGGVLDVSDTFGLAAPRDARSESDS